MTILQQILNLILPPRCLQCGKVLNDADGLCPECFNEITFISQPYCQKCGRPFAEVSAKDSMLCGHCLAEKKSVFRMNRSAFIYDDVSKPLILAFKFYDKTENAAMFARWMKNAGKDIFEQGVDVIVPVPLHYTRLVKRRYNQSGLLAKELGIITGYKVDYDSVVRHKHTRPQVEFSGHARIKNVKDAFSVKHPEQIKDRRVLLVDDVMTTGSTLRECTLAIKAAGAKSVDTITVARVY